MHKCKERRQRTDADDSLGGIDLSMEMSEIITQLEDLACHCSSMIDKEDPESIWKTDAEALNEAIRKLKGEHTGEDAAEIIRQILEKEGMNQKELAEKMGITRQNVSQMLNRNKVSMRFDGFSKMIQSLGYEIIVRKK